MSDCRRVRAVGKGFLEVKKQVSGVEQLNQEQKLFLELVACFAHDEKAELGEVPSCLENLAHLAGVHKLSPAVFEVLRTSLRKDALTQHVFWASWKGSAIREIIFQTQRTESFLSLYRKLVEAGVKPLVVKGIVCRSLYSKSDYRVSADEDVLIRKEDAAVCDKILCEQGFFRDKLDLENLPHEIGYRNPGNGVYIELHFSLFEEDSDIFSGLNDVFADVFESAECVRVQDVDVWTLNATKHFLYLICHCYKHFLYSGFGVRQVCDIIIMAEKWGERMDWQYLNEQIKSFQMECFFEGLLNIGYGWLHMDPQVYEYVGKAASSQEQQHSNRAESVQIHVDSGKTVPSMEEVRESALDLVQDILTAGIYGSSTKERLHSANITLAAAKKESGVLNALFPGINYMKSRYHFVEKYPILLPAAWCARFGDYLMNGGLKKTQVLDNEDSTESGNSLEIGKKRVELIRKYGLIK